MKQTSRESGVEIPAAQVSATRKTIEDTFAKPLRVSFPASYPQRWDDVLRMRAKPQVAAMRALLDRRIAEKPDEAERISDRAWLSERLFDWAGAEAGYSKALALDASAPRYRQRASLRSRRGDQAGALKDAQAAYDLEPR